MTATADQRPGPADAAAAPADRRREARRRARTPRSTCCGCSTTGSCGSPRTASTTPTGTASCSPRATGRRRTTRCWRPRASSREDWLDDLAGPDSRLGHHPDRLLVPGVEIGSGSLGHGLGLAVGTALGLRAQGLPRPRVYVLLGDAELDEGSNHEAIAYAGATGLDSLTAIVIDNRVGHARLAGRDRQPVHRQRLDGVHGGRPRPRRHRDGADARTPRAAARRRRPASRRKG